MAGYVRTNEKCPVCREAFKEELIGRSIALICPVHRTMPRRFYVDTSGFGLKKRKRYAGKDGKPFSSREAAQQFLDALRMAFADRLTWDPKEWDEIDAKEFRFGVEWAKWTEAKEPEWSARYCRQVEWVRSRIVAPRWGSLDVRDIRNAHLIDLKTAVAKEYAPSVTKLVIGVVCSFLSELRRRGDIKETLSRPTVKVPQRDLWILDATQQEAIIGAASARYHPILRLTARSGRRPCEVCAVRVMDVVGGYMHFQRSIDDGGNVADTKTGAIHRVPIPADMAGEIAAAMKGKLPGAYLFTGRTGMPIRPGTLSRQWNKAAKAVGLGGSTLYVGTRHSFATRTWREEETAAKTRTARALGDTAVVTFKHYVGRISHGQSTDNGKSNT